MSKERSVEMACEDCDESVTERVRFRAVELAIRSASDDLIQDTDLLLSRASRIEHYVTKGDSLG